MEIATLASLYLRLGIVGFVLVCFMAAFWYMLYKQMKTMGKIYNVLYEQNTNNLSLQSAYDIIESQCNLSKYAFIESVMHIHYQNHISDPARQKVIRDNLNIVAKNLRDRDVTILSRLKYKSMTLDSYLSTHGDYEKIAVMIYDNLLAKYSPTDILAILHNEFNTIINCTCRMLDGHFKS